MEKVRIYNMPPCRMVSSGRGMFGDSVLEEFDEWFSAQPRGMFPKDFLWHDGTGFVWYFMADENTSVPETFETVDFPGGLYVVVTGRDGDDESRREAMMAVAEFLDGSAFERDPDRPEMGNVITPPEASALGYEQMDYYIPVKVK